jgi:hypothetical protein
MRRISALSLAPLNFFAMPSRLASYQPKISVTLPELLLKRFQKSGISLDLQHKFTQLVPTLLNPTQRPMLSFNSALSAEQLKILALAYATTDISTQLNESFLNLAACFNQGLIINQSNQLIKKLFSQGPLEAELNLMNYFSPNVIKATYQSFHCYSPMIKRQILSSGLLRAGVAMARLKTSDDVFQNTDLDVKPLVLLKDRFSEPGLLHHVDHLTSTPELQAAMLLIHSFNQVQKTGISHPSVSTEVLIAHLITAPFVLQGGAIESIALEKSIHALMATIKNHEAHELIQCLSEVSAELELDNSYSLR